MSDTDLPSIGHNSGPSEAAAPAVTRELFLDPDLIRDDLVDRYKAVAQRSDDLVHAAVRAFAIAANVRVVAEAPTGGTTAPDGGGRLVEQARGKTGWTATLWETRDGTWFKAAQRPVQIMQRLAGAGAKIADDDASATLIAFVTKQIKPAQTALEDGRKNEKSGYDRAAAAVQAWFKPYQDELEAARKATETLLLDPYRKAVEAEARRRLAQEAEKRRRDAEEARAAAAAALQAAESVQTDAAFTVAIQAGDEADDAAQRAAQAERASNVNAAQLSHQRSDLGGSMTARTTWTFRVVDKTQIPHEYLLVDERALAAMARNMKDKAAVPGVQFVPSTTTVLRG